MAESINALEARRSGLSVVARGTLVYFVSSLVFIAMTFAWRVILVRTLSVAGWSNFSDALAIAASVGTAGGLGLQSALARNIPYSRHDDERRAIIHAGLVIGGLSCIALPVSLYLAGPAIGSVTGSNEVGFALQILGLTYGLAAGVALLTAVFQGFENVWPISVFGLILGPTLFVGVLGTYYVLPGLHLTFAVALWAYAGSWLVTFGAAALYTYIRLPRTLPAGPRAHGQSVPLVIFALPLLGVAVFSTLDGFADTIILGAYQLSNVGTYVASLTLSRLLPIGVGALAVIILPVTSRLLKNHDQGSAELIYATATKWTAVFALPLFLVFAFLPENSLRLVYGPSYTSLTIPLTITAAGSFFSTVMGPSTAIQLSLGRTHLMLANAGTSLTADVVLAVVLVPAYGVIGAAVAWAVATCVYPALAVIELAALDHIHPFRREYFVPLLAIGIPGAIALSIASHFPIALWAVVPTAIAFAALYTLAIPLTGSMDSGDALLLEVIERFIGRRLQLARRFLAWGSRNG